jgi:hypothetical protein
MAKLFLTDIDMNGAGKVVNLADPASAQDAATKAYVDSAVEGLAWKDSVRAASTASLTLSGPGASIDGVTLSNGDRVLVKNQSTGSENGLYIFNGSGSAMTRTVDMSTAAEVEQAVVTVEEGTTNAGTTWRQTAVNVTLGTTALAWTSFGTAAGAATETTAGVVELATQSETDTGTDDARAVTPLKLKNYPGAKLPFAQTIGDASATAFNIDHNFNTRDVVVAVFKNSGNYDDVLADVTRPTVNRVTVTFASAPASNAYRVVVQAS